MNTDFDHRFRRSAERAGLPPASRRVTASCLTAMTMVLAAGCSVLQPVVGSSSYYILTARPEASQAQSPAKPAGSPWELRLAPVDLADYLQTRSIAVRTQSNQIDFSPVHYWAEPLDDGIRRVLADDLRGSPLLSRVLTVQPPQDPSKVYTLSVHVLACGGIRQDHRQGSVEFRAIWQINGPGVDGPLVGDGQFQAKPEEWDGSDYLDLARKLSDDLESFGRVLLQAVAHCKGAGNSVTKE